jgi:dihydroxyacetone kinase DhaKLM complex PTS-EIIA-like component DhaM
LVLAEPARSIAAIELPSYRKEERLVGLVLVSHSATLVDGLREMVVQVAGDATPVATAGGTDDGRLGTSAPRIAAAIRSAIDAGASETLVLLDLGSAALSLELATEELDDTERARVLAAVQASIGASIDDVVAAAESAATMTKLPRS